MSELTSIVSPTSESSAPGAERGGHGGEDVASVERRSGCGEVEVGVGERDRGRRAPDHGDCRGEQAVVRADEDRLAVADLDRDGPPGRADAGVDDGEHHARAQVLGAAGQGQATGPDVVAGHIVA